MLSYWVVSVVLYKINKANVKRCALFFWSFDCIMSGAWEQYIFWVLGCRASCRNLPLSISFPLGVFTRCSYALNKSLRLKPEREKISKNIYFSFWQRKSNANSELQVYQIFSLFANIRNSVFCTVLNHDLPNNRKRWKRKRREQCRAWPLARVLIDTAANQTVEEPLTPRNSANQKRLNDVYFAHWRRIL